MSGATLPASGYRERNTTADRALDILMMFTDEQPVITGNEIAENLGVSRSTAYRYLQSLVNSRFLEEAPGGGFRLGLRILEIARLARRSYGLSEVALPAMKALSEAAQETVLLTRRVGDLVVCVDRVEVASRPVRLSYERGSSLPLNAGASALTLLAWSPPAEVRKLLSDTRLHKFTPATLTSVGALMERLAEIREQGYSVTRAELDSDVIGIAAPIRDESGNVVAAVSAVALASRVDAEAEPRLVEQVVRAAKQISDALTVVAG